MDHLLIDAKYTGDVKLNSETISYCKKFKTIGLYASVQFTHLLEPVVKSLESEGIKVISSTPARANEKYQILGCNAFYGSLKLSEEPDAFLYIGDGMFHPRALVLAQKDKEQIKDVIKYDPIHDTMTKLGEDGVRKILMKYRGSLLKFMMAESIGVIITVKPGQIQFNSAKELREQFPDKNVYLFAGDTIDYSKMDDFNFIDSWVNTACPRMGFEDASEFSLSMVNVTDALKVKEILGRDSVLTRIK